MDNEESDSKPPCVTACLGYRRPRRPGARADTAAARISARAGIGGWLTQLVAARRLGARLVRDHNRDRGEEQLVDVLRGPVVWTDRQDHSLVGRWPGRQHAVIAVQVTATDVVKGGAAGKAISGLLAAACRQCLEGLRVTWGRRPRSAAIWRSAVRVSPTSMRASASQATTRPGTPDEPSDAPRAHVGQPSGHVLASQRLAVSQHS